MEDPIHLDKSSETEDSELHSMIDDPTVKYAVAAAFVMALLVLVVAPLFTCYVLPMMRRGPQYQPIADV